MVILHDDSCSVIVQNQVESINLIVYHLRYHRGEKFTQSSDKTKMLNMLIYCFAGGFFESLFSDSTECHLLVVEDIDSSIGARFLHILTS